MDELDRILLSEQKIAPRPGFVPRVMASVRRELQPQPLRFPWAALGLAILAFLVVTGLVGTAAMVLGKAGLLADLGRRSMAGLGDEAMLWLIGVLLGSGLAAFGAWELIDD